MQKFFFRMSVALAFYLCALTAPAAQAQLPVPRLNSIFPCGARQGTTVECSVAGADLDGAAGLYFSHAGITAEPAGLNKFKVSVGRAVPVGQYDVRVVGRLGVSNCRAFVVSDWPEVVEKEPNDERDQAQRVSLPVVINGRMDKTTDIDQYVFTARKGQRVLINCWAWRIDSQLDGTLMVYDARGKELAYSGDYYGKDPFIDFTAPEEGDYTVKIWDFIYGGGSDYFYRLHIASLPHIDAVFPAAVHPGEKATLTLYGRNLPGGKPAPSGAQIQGRPLEVLTQEFEVPAGPDQAVSLRRAEAVRPPQSLLDGMDYRLHTAAGSSNPLFLAFTSDPILVEREPNNDRKSAQRLPVPCDVTGAFSPAGDLDFYAFSAKKGEKLVVEVFGERQSGLVDPFLIGLDAAGKRLFSLDDSGRNLGQLRFNTSTRDPRWDFTAPAAGEYFVEVRDLYHQQRGAPHFVYRLSVHAPRPDFRLVVVPKHDVQPDAPVVGRGGRQWVDVLALRNDGFDDPIRIEASALPPGVTCSPVILGPGKTSVPLVLEAAKDAPLAHAEIRVIGKAKIEDREVVRVARSGGLTWPTVNTPGIARMADATVLAVREPPPFALTAGPSKTMVRAGEKLPIRVEVQRAPDWAQTVQLSGYDLPPNATLGLVAVPKTANEATVELTLPASVRPGTYTFTVNGAGQVPRDYARERDPKKPREPNVRVVYPSNAITLTIEPAPSAKK